MTWWPAGSVWTAPPSPAPTVAPGIRLCSLAEVIEHLGADGRTGIIDGTEIRVRRRAAGRKDRDKFASGKTKQNAVKSMVLTASGPQPSLPRRAVRTQAYLFSTAMTAAPTYKGGFGSHPLVCFLANTGEARVSKRLGDRVA